MENDLRYVRVRRWRPKDFKTQQWAVTIREAKVLQKSTSHRVNEYKSMELVAKFELRHNRFSSTNKGLASDNKRFSHFNL